jgi:hypothetical protein
MPVVSGPDYGRWVLAGVRGVRALISIVSPELHHKIHKRVVRFILLAFRYDPDVLKDT